MNALQKLMEIRDIIKDTSGKYKDDSEKIGIILLTALEGINKEQTTDSNEISLNMIMNKEGIKLSGTNTSNADLILFNMFLYECIHDRFKQRNKTATQFLKECFDYLEKEAKK